ncbi:hypothetical protein Tco_1270896 [Tanacetum coccineum]
MTVSAHQSMPEFPSLSKRPRVGRYQRGGNSLGRSQCLMRNNHCRNSLANLKIPTPNSSTHIRCSGTSSLDRPCVDGHQHGTSSSTVGEQSMHTVNNPSISVGVGTAANDCTSPINSLGPPSDYQYTSSCDHSCQHYRARFWYEERIKDNPRNARPKFHRMAGRVVWVMKKKIIHCWIDFASIPSYRSEFAPPKVHGLHDYNHLRDNTKAT